MDEQEEKVVKVPVTIITEGEKQSVVQWLVGDEPFRATVKNSQIKGNEVSVDDLKKATPYGIDFEDVGLELPDVFSVMSAFHKHGIWTAADVRKNPQSVLSALSSLYSPNLRALMAYIKAKKI